MAYFATLMSYYHYLPIFRISSAGLGSPQWEASEMEIRSLILEIAVALPIENVWRRFAKLRLMEAVGMTIVAG